MRTIVAPTGNDAAFAALVAFTAILLVAPQAWFPAIKSLRIALLAAGVAIVSHLAGRAFAATPALPVRREMVIALALVVWAAFTIPLSIWPGGSLSALTDHLIKAVVFFWLIGTVITTTPRLELFGWVLTVCSLPLAVTALDNYRTGVFVTHASSAVQRIAGYVGGSGLAGNPNDLALMLNLLMPITGALFVISRRPWLRVIAGAALMLSVAAVIVTFSRAGFITLAAIAVLSLAAMVRRGAAGTALLIVFLAVGAFVVLPSEYFARLATITNIESDPTGSAQGRWSDYFLSLDYIRQHPLTGAGLGQDLLALNAARGYDTWRSVHNAYLQAAVDLGLARRRAAGGAAPVQLRQYAQGAAAIAGHDGQSVASRDPWRKACASLSWRSPLRRSFIRLPISSISSASPVSPSPWSTPTAPRLRPHHERHPADESRADAALRRHRKPLHDAVPVTRCGAIRSAFRLPPPLGTIRDRADGAPHSA